ncbi:MAG: hypothetical protein Q4F02_03665 [Candidatus Saccharibacteria bacterium]|nr:hypothetical protein [Candidatus Saccharibacteria bacterium]
MWELCKQIIANWNSEKNQRIKLQQAYFIMALIGLASAGLMMLFNVSLSHALASTSGIFLITMLANGVVWVFVDTLISPKLPKNQPKSSRKRSSRA